LKIEVDLPDWVEGKNIYIFGNLELIAKKIYLRSWEVKESRCNHCGECCKNYHDLRGYLPTTPENGCSNLEQRKDGTWWCKAHIPISCLISNKNPKLDHPCSVRWKKIEETDGDNPRTN